jgi:hypothetical protein
MVRSDKDPDTSSPRIRSSRMSSRPSRSASIRVLRGTGYGDCEVPILIYGLITAFPQRFLENPWGNVRIDLFTEPVNLFVGERIYVGKVI